MKNYKHVKRVGLWGMKWQPSRPDPRCDCGARITENDNDGEMCTACNAEYWRDWCEECNADPGEPCAEDCPNESKGEPTHVAGLPLWSVDDLKTAGLDELRQLFGNKGATA